VFVNGKPILNAFDIVADADGANVADERVVRDISPAEDGLLHLSFASFRGAAMLNAIEVLPITGGKLRPVRVRAGWLTSWQDPAGQQWQGDSYFLGGNALVRTTNPARASDAPDAASSMDPLITVRVPRQLNPCRSKPVNPPLST